MQVLCLAHTILDLTMRGFRNLTAAISLQRGFFGILWDSIHPGFGVALAGSHCYWCERTGVRLFPF
jgi:hypothetical protein